MPRSHRKPNPPAPGPDIASILGGLAANPGVLDETVREPHQIDLEELTDPDGNPPVDDAPEDLTIGEAGINLAVDPELPTLRGFEMIDMPPYDPDNPEADTAASPPPAGVSAASAGGGRAPDVPAPEPEFLTPRAMQARSYSSTSAVRYEGRIRILEAFQYLGRLDSAPGWIDRNWLGWGDFDDLRRIEAGPCLRVPLPSGQAAVARVGDFVVQQEVVLQHGMLSDVRVEVWAKDDFARNFMPVAD